MPLPSRFTVVSKPAASTSPAVALSSASSSPTPSSCTRTSWLIRSSPDSRRRCCEVRVEPRLELPQPALHPAELAEPQPQVEARRRGVAELQHPAAVLGRYAEDLRDHGHRQLAQYAETRSTGLVGSSESSSSSAICCVRDAQVLHRPGREDPRDQLAVAGVVGRLADQQRRGHQRTELAGLLGPHGHPAQDAVAGLEDPGAEVGAGQHLLDDRQRGGHQGELGAVQRPAGPDLVGEGLQSVGVVGDPAGDQPPLHVAASRRHPHQHAGQPVPERPADGGPHRVEQRHAGSCSSEVSSPRVCRTGGQAACRRRRLTNMRMWRVSRKSGSPATGATFACAPAIPPRPPRSERTQAATGRSSRLGSGVGVALVPMKLLGSDRRITLCQAEKTCLGSEPVVYSRP